MEKKKFNWKPLAAVIVFVVLAVAMVWCGGVPVPPPWRAARSHLCGSRPQGRLRGRLHLSDRQEYLGEALLEEGLIAGSESEFGLYVETVDGETASYDADQSYWWLTCNGEDSQTGADQVVLADGDHFVWTYTVG